MRLKKALLLTLNLLTTTIVAPPSNASKWQMGFNSAFKGLKIIYILLVVVTKQLVHVACKDKVQVVCLHTRQTAKGVLEGFIKKKRFS
jgi:hypothetical protein